MRLGFDSPHGSFVANFLGNVIIWYNVMWYIYLFFIETTKYKSSYVNLEFKCMQYILQLKKPILNEFILRPFARFLIVIVIYSHLNKCKYY